LFKQAVQSIRQTGPSRFIDEYYFDEGGMGCEYSQYFLNLGIVLEKAKCDGFYCVATNLEDPASSILRVN